MLSHLCVPIYMSLRVCVGRSDCEEYARPVRDQCTSWHGMLAPVDFLRRLACSRGYIIDGSCGDGCGGDEV